MMEEFLQNRNQSAEQPLVKITMNCALTATEFLLNLVPQDGSSIGNQALLQAFSEALKASNHIASAADFETVKNDLIVSGVLVKGKGRGGSVRRADAEPTAFDLAVQAIPPDAANGKAAPKGKTVKLLVKPAPAGETAQIIAYRHPDKRTNNPEVGMVTPATDPEAGKTRWAYDPHIDPALQFDPGRAGLEKMIDEALAACDPESMRAALEELKRQQSPQSS